MPACSLLLLSFVVAQTSPASSFESGFVFPLHPQHNHAPSIVECPNGDLLVSWYRGSGEDDADDVAVFGSRRRKGSSEWSEAFLMVDTPGFPDGNTAMYIDSHEKLWLFWPLILANSWESCYTQYLTSVDYQGDGPPKWLWRESISLKPQNFRDLMLRELEERLKSPDDAIGVTERRVSELKPLVDDKLTTRM